ncbi:MULTISPECIES: hypothetical protein [Streptomyces]|uniref:Uncharacterized protein n=2 Tax=Streptomyces rimosus subsp. rimosus TaxID=132474 RepID=L8EYU4_STRR1|nr:MULTISPECIES: hypothetical protein [Streptomyces]KOG71151.1 hypothetical protein ADK78_25675 [Kitasatospora aureofaciens]MYT47923.1 hypothetical protein [Streptomyces sp. SID5471]KEF03601.1 hypothetical protein DF17_27505 [Streptomyces rimosus]KEF16903.1 hypothetical protein DF18_32425 [Streptomyces rimosus]KOT34482.1 hypothetical protein ADK42_22215 [Streptomyces rimosus subsp. rimosus]
MTALTCTSATLALAAVGRLLATAVALLARDPARRDDARKVLRLLLAHHPTRRANRARPGRRANR